MKKNRLILAVLFLGAAAIQNVEASGSKKEMLQQSKTAPAGETVTAAGMTWFTDLNSALAEAKKTKRPIFLLGTGSDWCGFCMRLEKNVLQDKTFQKYAESRLVLLYADSPSKKEQSPEVAANAQALLKKFKIEGFPTVILLSSEGKELGRKAGYDGSNAKKYIEMLKGMLKK